MSCMGGVETQRQWKRKKETDAKRLRVCIYAYICVYVCMCSEVKIFGGSKSRALNGPWRTATEHMNANKEREVRERIIIIIIIIIIIT